MDIDDAPETDEDFVERIVMAWGLPGFFIGFLAVIAAIFYIIHRAIYFFFPGA